MNQTKWNNIIFKKFPRMAWLIYLLGLAIVACVPGEVAGAGTPLSQATTTHEQTTPTLSQASLVPPPTVTGTATLTPSATLTPTATLSPSIRFAVIGDYGSGDPAEADVAALVYSWAPDFIITTGDNNYPSGSAGTIDDHIGQFYHDFIYPYSGAYGPGASENRFFPSLGNHDWYTPGAQPYLDYFTLPGNERYYEFVWGSVHFFALDGDPSEPDGVGKSSLQAAWLQERLAASTSPWKIVYDHHPPYSSARHGNTDWMQWPFKEWGATAMLSGHDHTYERILLDDFPYFVNGLGGQSRYNFDAAVPGSQVRYNADYGAMLVEASETSMTFQFITRQGELVDEYQLVKEVAYAYQLYLPIQLHRQ